MKKPYEQGYEAYKHGVWRSENPYSDGTPEHDEWERGFLQAEQDE